VTALDEIREQHRFYCAEAAADVVTVHGAHIGCQHVPETHTAAGCTVTGCPCRAGRSELERRVGR